MNEIWKAIDECPGYFVSDMGNVKSYKLDKEVGRVLRPQINHNGYLRVILMLDGKGLKRRVHRLVLTSFVGECPEGHECSHKDGNRENNRLDNLQWLSQLENDREKELHGTSNRKLTEAQVLEIRERYTKGETVYKIAKDYPVADKTISGVVKREHWKHI